MLHARKPVTCRLEALEDRQLLAITTQLLDGGATLRLVGDAQQEVVYITQDDASDNLMVNWFRMGSEPVGDLPQPIQSFNSSKISKIVIELRGGNDQLHFVLGSDQLLWAKNISVDMGTGDDSVFIDMGGLLVTTQEGDASIPKPTGHLGDDVVIDPIIPDPSELEAPVRIDVKAGAGNDTVDAVFGNVHANLVYRVDGGIGNDQLSAAQAGRIYEGSAVLFELTGGEGNDHLSNSLGQDGIARGGQLSILQRGGNGQDVLQMESYGSSIQGRLMINQFGGNGNDTIASTVLAHWGSEGSLAARVYGENGNDQLTVKLKREALPPNIDLFRAIQEFPIAAVANGGMGRNQAWITPNVRSFLSAVKDRSWDNGFPIPVAPWPY
ncbi:MAG: hypothetical protein U0796_15125 [Gemmatales bacterium]